MCQAMGIATTITENYERPKGLVTAQEKAIKSGLLEPHYKRYKLVEPIPTRLMTPIMYGKR